MKIDVLNENRTDSINNFFSEKTQLPNGWQWVNLEDTCDFLDHQRIPVNEIEREKRIKNKDKSELYPYYGANGLAGYIDGYLFDEPLILLAEDGADFGSITSHIAYSVSGKCWVNNHAHVLRPKKNVDFNYLLYCLIIRPELKPIVTQSTRAKLNQATARKISIPLPPKSEQERIVTIVQDKMKILENLRAHALSQIQVTNTISDAYLQNLFSNPSMSKWKSKPLNNLVEINAKIVDPRESQYSSLPHINGENIVGGLCKIKNIHSIKEDEITSGNFHFAPGDVLYSKLRPYLRKVAIVDFEGLCSADMYPLTVTSKELEPQYLAWVLLSHAFTKWAIGESARSRMPKLNRGQLLSWKIPLPEDTVQKHIADVMFEKTRLISELQLKIEEQLSDINKLKYSILKQAFRGEL